MPTRCLPVYLVIDKEVIKASDTQKGDWKPLVFLMSSGLSTDSWEKPAKRLKMKF